MARLVREIDPKLRLKTADLFFIHIPAFDALSMNSLLPLHVSLSALGARPEAVPDEVVSRAVNISFRMLR